MGLGDSSVLIYRTITMEAKVFTYRPTGRPRDWKAKLNELLRMPSPDALPLYEEIYKKVPDEWFYGIRPSEGYLL